MVRKKHDPVSGQQTTIACRSCPEDGEGDIRANTFRRGSEDAGQGRTVAPVPVGMYVLAALIIRLALALYLPCHLPVGSR